MTILAQCTSSCAPQDKACQASPGPRPLVFDPDVPRSVERGRSEFQKGAARESRFSLGTPTMGHDCRMGTAPLRPASIRYRVIEKLGSDSNFTAISESFLDARDHRLVAWPCSGMSVLRRKENLVRSFCFLWPPDRVARYFEGRRTEVDSDPT